MLLRSRDVRLRRRTWIPATIIWKAFVTAVVTHSLSSPELHIAYYELWNEPDFKRNWTGTPAQLVTMAKDAYAIIHKLDPKAPFDRTIAFYGQSVRCPLLARLLCRGRRKRSGYRRMHAYLYDGGSFSSSPDGITVTITQLKTLMASMPSVIKHLVH